MTVSPQFSPVQAVKLILRSKKRETLLTSLYSRIYYRVPYFVHLVSQTQIMLNSPSALVILPYFAVFSASYLPAARANRHAGALEEQGIVSSG